MIHRLLCAILGHRWRSVAIANLNQHRFRCARCGEESWLYVPPPIRARGDSRKRPSALQEY